MASRASVTSFERIRKFYFDIEDINYVPALFRTDFIAKLEVATALRDKIYVDKTKEERQNSINVLKDNQPIYIAEFESELNNRSDQAEYEFPEVEI